MDTGLRGLTALVVASTSGLGLAVAQGLSAEGADVVVSGRRGDVAEQVAARLPSAMGIRADLAEPGTPSTLVSAATERFGPVDILVLNSGGPPPGEAAQLDPAQLRAAVDTMLLQQIALVRLVLPGMLERGWGRVVAIGSSGVQQPLSGLALSNSVRAALAGYLKTLAREVATQGVTVNMVLPGRIDTPRVQELDRARAERDQEPLEQVRARSQGTIPVGRYGRPEEFAAVVTFLCSTAASYVTGEQVRCDGGLVASY